MILKLRDIVINRESVNNKDCIRFNMKKVGGWDAYKELVSVDEEETEEVTEYASLVGKQVASRMLLYRPN